MSKYSRLILLRHRILSEWHQYKQRKQHKDGPFETDPIEDLLPRLAMFARALAAISDYSDQNNKAGMVFGVHLADALHNQTSLGGHLSLTRRLDHKGNDTDQTWTDPRLERLPKLVREYAPPEVSQRCNYILSGTDVLQELGLKEDLSNLSLAPPQMMARYSKMLHNACIDMRMIGIVGSYPPKPDEASKWTEYAYRRGEINGKLAKMLGDLPPLSGSLVTISPTQILAQSSTYLEDNARVLSEQHSKLHALF